MGVVRVLRREREWGQVARGDEPIVAGVTKGMGCP